MGTLLKPATLAMWTRRSPASSTSKLGHRRKNSDSAIRLSVRSIGLGDPNDVADDLVREDRAEVGDDVERVAIRERRQHGPDHVAHHLLHAGDAAW